MVLIIEISSRSGEGKSQHKPKRSLFAAIQESTRQIAKLDSGQANVSRAKLSLVFSVTPFKIDQNINQSRLIDKVQNLGNERRYIFKDPCQDSGQRNVTYTRYPKKCFTQAYRDLYGNAILVLTWMSSDMAGGNQQKHLLPSLAKKA